MYIASLKINAFDVFFLFFFTICFFFQSIYCNGGCTGFLNTSGCKCQKMLCDYALHRHLASFGTYLITAAKRDRDILDSEKSEWSACSACYCLNTRCIDF